MRILHLTSNFLPNMGGIEIDLHYNLNYFGKNNIDSRLLVPFSFKRLFLKSDYKKYLIPRNRLLNNYNWFKISLSLIYFFWKFDVIFCSSCSFEAYYALKWRDVKFKSKSKKIKIIAKTSGSDIKAIEDISYGQMLDEKMKTIINFAVKKCDAIIANSDLMRKEAEKILNNPEKNVYVIPNGCNICKSYFINLSKKECKSMLGIASDEIVFTHITRDSKIKNTELFIELAKQIIEENIKVKFIIIGQISENIQKILSSNDLKKYFLLTGEIERFKFKKFKLYHDDEEYLKILKATDIGVFTSFFESFGNAAAEFGYLGIPVIVNKSYGLSNFLQNGAEELITDELSVENYLKIVNLLLKNNNIIRFGNIIENNFSKLDSEIIIFDYIKVFERVLNT